VGATAWGVTPLLDEGAQAAATRIAFNKAPAIVVVGGPNLSANYTDTGTQGRGAGRDYGTLAEDGRGTDFETVMVQIPAPFNTGSPCLVTGPSSGARTCSACTAWAPTPVSSDLG
jgi:hypothetical protein